MTIFPIKSNWRSEVSDGVYVETSMTLYENGHLDCVTHSWTNNTYQGAHAVAAVILYDANNHALWCTAPHMCGVAGKLDFTGSSDRTVPWNEQVPPHVMQQVNGYAIIHKDRKGSDTLDWLKSTARSKSTHINIVEIDQSGASIGVGYTEQAHAEHLSGTIKNST